MHQAATPEKTQTEIPLAFLEYTAVFKKPILGAVPVPAELIATILDALGPFGFTLEGVETKTHPEKLSEYALVFRRSVPGVTFTLHLGKLIIGAENLDWTDAEQFIAGVRAGVGAILQKTRAEIQSQHLALHMHVQLKAKPREQVTAPLLSPTALQLMDGEIKFPGIILLRDKASIIIDGSVPYANGLYVRIIREHPGDRSFEQISEMLLADEKQLFDTLGLEGDL